MKVTKVSHKFILCVTLVSLFLHYSAYQQHRDMMLDFGKRSYIGSFGFFKKTTNPKKKFRSLRDRLQDFHLSPVSFFF